MRKDTIRIVLLGDSPADGRSAGEQRLQHTMHRTCGRQPQIAIELCFVCFVFFCQSPVQSGEKFGQIRWKWIGMACAIMLV